jgi:hypothetical protein
MHNLYEAYRRIYEAIGVPNIEGLLPAPTPPQPTDPAIENAKSLIQENLQAFPTQDHDAHIQAHIIFMKTPIPASTPPIFALLQAHLCEHVAFKARGVATAEMSMAAQQAAQMGQQEQPQDVEARVSQLVAEYMAEVMSALMPPPEGEVDPLVQLRSKELDIKASDVQRKVEEFTVKQAFEEQREEERQDITREKMDSQEDIALLRADVNLDRIEKMGSAGRGE